jgi:hypothetical protein
MSNKDNFDYKNNNIDKFDDVFEIEQIVKNISKSNIIHTEIINAIIDNTNYENIICNPIEPKTNINPFK